MESVFIYLVTKTSPQSRIACASAPRKYIKEYLPSECENIVDALQFEYDIDEDEYLEQALENENEDEYEI